MGAENGNNSSDKARGVETLDLHPLMVVLEDSLWQQVGSLVLPTYCTSQFSHFHQVNTY